jgi:hypothetical protein
MIVLINPEIIKPTAEENARNKWHVFQWVSFVNNVYTECLKTYVTNFSCLSGGGEYPGKVCDIGFETSCILCRYIYIYIYIYVTISRNKIDFVQIVGYYAAGPSTE